MNSQEKYRIGMFRDTGMTPEAIAKQLNYKLKTVTDTLAKIDEENVRVHHFCSVGVVVRVWDTILKRYVEKEFEINVDFKSIPYQEGVEMISESIRQMVDQEKIELS